MGSHDGAVTRPWGDGDHVFRLPIDQLLELQERCGAGPVEILDRLCQRRWRVQDVRETIRLALIGGGMAPLEALARVKRYVDSRPLLESIEPAVAALGAALVGPVEDDAPGKQTAGAGQDGSPPPPSTEPAAP